jgi:hypothetical protein
VASLFLCIALGESFPNLLADAKPSQAIGVGHIHIELDRGEFASKWSERVLHKQIGFEIAGKMFDDSVERNVSGAIEIPVVLECSKGEASPQWIDVVVPFGTEDRWVKQLGQLDKVSHVFRKGVGGAEKGTASEAQLAQIKALEFSINCPPVPLATLFDAIKRALVSAYPKGTAEPILQEAAGILPNQRSFRIRGGQLISQLSKWQKVYVTITRSESSPPTAKLEFTGQYASGMGPFEPPDVRYRSMLLPDEHGNPKLFREHAALTAAAIESQINQ